MENKKVKTFSLDEVTDKYVSKKGTTKRDSFEKKERNLTQAFMKHFSSFIRIYG